MQLRIPSIIFWAIIILSLIGFTDAAFLLAKRISGTPIPCFITSGCDTVSKSPYSVLFGVPLSAWGVLFYLGTGFLALFCVTSASDPRQSASSLLVAKLIPLATTLGFLSSLYFLYIQKIKIGAFCIYCILSAIVSTVLFGLGVVVYKKLQTK
ncbi:MAG: vitamin K epoxide reductase family protein [Candidatus Yonathbacteria bacterium]|nr:vitamin K epoxide reductase family protein [Candidatus Yonathbacteria bacterium]